MPLRNPWWSAFQEQFAGIWRDVVVDMATIDLAGRCLNLDFRHIFIQLIYPQGDGVLAHFTGVHLLVFCRCYFRFPFTSVCVLSRTFLKVYLLLADVAFAACSAFDHKYTFCSG